MAFFQKGLTRVNSRIAPAVRGEETIFAAFGKCGKTPTAAGRGLDRPFAREYNILSENSFSGKRRPAAGALRPEKHFET